MIANAKSGWRVAAAIAIAGGILAAAVFSAQRRQKPAFQRDRARLSEADVVGRDAGRHPLTQRVEVLHTAGVRQLRSRASGGAVRFLGEAVELAETAPISAPRKAALLNDFAVAHHELAADRNSMSLIIGLDAAQKAWALDPTPVTTWTRAVLLDALAGADAASDAWADYLRIDSTSEWAQEARRESTSPVILNARDPNVAREEALAAWANGVLGRRPQDERRALRLLVAEGHGEQITTHDAFWADVATWLGSFAHDPVRKAAAAEAILLLRSGRKALATRELDVAEACLRRAVTLLRDSKSPLAITGAVHLAVVLDSGGRIEEAAGILRGNVNACDPERNYLAACGAQNWVEGILEFRNGRASAALSRYDRALKTFERTGDTARRARLLLLHADTLDSMRATNEAWADRINAARLTRSNRDLRDVVLTRVAIAAARDGFYYAADELFAHVQRGSVKRLAAWRAFTRARIEGDRSDPNLHLVRLGLIEGDGTFIRARARFTSARRGMVTVSVDGLGVVSPSPVRGWSQRIDEFVPDHVQREAIGVMVVDSVRRLYEDQSRMELMNGSTTAALWMSDRARRVGVPSKETSGCIDESEVAGTEAMGRKLIECVPPGVTLVHQDLDWTTLHTWVVREGRAELTTTWVSSVQLTADITRFREAIAGQAATASILTQSQYLYDILLRPVQQQIAGTDLLVYSPSSNLRGFPVTALHDGTRFLIETRPVVTTPTISAFTPARTARNDSTALVVLPQAVLNRLTLDGAHREVRAVSRIYQGRSSLLREQAATPDVFLKSATAYDILHIATHGQTGGLPYQNFIEFGHERLRAYDIFNLRLKRKPIVMLAACRTADSSGGPLNVGLTDAFLAAGASAVVGSLWNVEDRPTEQLSVGFHRELAMGAAPYDALRRVQLQFIRQGRPLSTWAAFQVSS